MVYEISKELLSKYNIPLDVWKSLSSDKEFVESFIPVTNVKKDIDKQDILIPDFINDFKKEETRKSAEDIYKTVYLALGTKEMKKSNLQKKVYSSLNKDI